MLPVPLDVFPATSVPIPLPIPEKSRLVMEFRFITRLIVLETKFVDVVVVVVVTNPWQGFTPL